MHRLLQAAIRSLARLTALSYGRLLGEAATGVYRTAWDVAGDVCGPDHPITAKLRQILG